MDISKVDITKFEPEIQNAIENFLLKAKEISQTFAHNEELKQITKKTLAEINAELQKLKG